MTIAIEVIEPHVDLITKPDRFVEFARICEEAGRESHRSEGAMTEKSYDRFLRKIAFKLGHESIIEHSALTVRLVGSRAMSHQLVRHRIAAYTQESQRYCDYTHPKFGKVLQVICPPSIGVEPGVYDSCDAQHMPALNLIQQRFVAFMLNAYVRYNHLREDDIPAEDARFVLPNACRTSVVTTYNIRQWRHFFRMRCDEHAQWEIRKLAKEILQLFISQLPCCFDDLKELAD